MKYKVVIESRYGRWIEIDDDSSQYFLQFGQRWIPHTVEDTSPLKLEILFLLMTGSQRT